MPVNRDEKRAQLAGMDPLDLLDECAICIARYREYKSDKDRRAMADLCYAECFRRERIDIWDKAVEREKAEHESRQRTKSGGIL